MLQDAGLEYSHTVSRHRVAVDTRSRLSLRLGHTVIQLNVERTNDWVVDLHNGIRRVSIHSCSIVVTRIGQCGLRAEEVSTVDRTTVFEHVVTETCWCVDARVVNTKLSRNVEFRRENRRHFDTEGFGNRNECGPIFQLIDRAVNRLRIGR